MCRGLSRAPGLGCCQFSVRIRHQTAGLRLYRASATVGTEDQGTLGIPIQKVSKFPPGALCGQAPGAVGLGPGPEKGWDGGCSSDFSGKRGERGGGGRPPREINKTYTLQSLPHPLLRVIPCSAPAPPRCFCCDSGSLTRGWGAAEEPEPSGTQQHHVLGWGL